MSFLKIGRHIINEDNVTHIDLDCSWIIENNLIEGACIWFTSPYHYPDEELGEIVNIPYCLKLTEKKDIAAVKYYYETIRRPSMLDLRELYDQSKVNLDNRDSWIVQN